MLRQKTDTIEIRRLLLSATGTTVLLVLAVLPGLFLSLMGLQSPWNLSRVARADLGLQENHLVAFATSLSAYRSEHTGSELVQAALIDATEWPSRWIALIPIGSLLLALLYYAASRSVSRSRWTYLAITLYAGWFYSRLVSQFGTHSYAWTHVLFLSFLILLLYWIRQATPILSLLIMLVFVATFLHYHATPLWMIAALATAFFAKTLSGRSKVKQPKASWSLLMFCIVFYLGFDTIIYSNGLVRLTTTPADESLIWSFVSKVIAPFLAKQPVAPTDFEIAVLNPRIATHSTLLALLLLTVPVGIWCAVKITNSIRSRNLRTLVRTSHDVFIWAILAATVVHSAIYSLYGAVSLRLIPLAFPLILPLVIQEIKTLKSLEPILMCLLAAFAIIGFLSFASGLRPDITTAETGTTSELFDDYDRVMGEPTVYASLFLDTIKTGRVLQFAWLDSDRYASVVGQKPIDRDEFDYLAADTSGYPITSTSWASFEPWKQHLTEIDSNKSLDKIYDSRTLKIYRPNDQDLPVRQLAPGEVDFAEERSFLQDVTRLFLATVLLVFIPGAILVVLLKQSSRLKIDDAATMVGIAVSLGVALLTYAGYVTNFTSLGLKRLVPLSIAVPWAILGIYWVIRRPRFQLQLTWFAVFACLSITVFVWALLSTGVAYARYERSTGYTEFFVTKASSDDTAVVVTVINRSKQPQDFSVVFKLAGSEVPALGPQTLAPGSMLSERIGLPLVPFGETLVIGLRGDEIPGQELHLNNLAKTRAHMNDQADVDFDLLSLSDLP